jgi:hypothetical protein
MMSQALGGVNSPCGWYRVRGQLPSTGDQDHTHKHTHASEPGVGHHVGCRVTAVTMVGVFLLFSHVKNAQCTDFYMKKGGQIKMSILTFFPARSWGWFLLFVKAFLAVVGLVSVLAIYC